MTATHTCENCWRDGIENERLCATCDSRLETDLAWFETHLEDLNWRANRADRTGDGGNGTPASSPAPLRESVHELIEGPDRNGNPGLRDILREYCRCLALNTTYASDVDVMARRIRLCYRRGKCAATPMYARIIHRTRVDAQRLLDYTLEDRVILGECPTRGCTHVTSATPQASFAPACPECGMVYPVQAIRESRRRRLLESDVTGTQSRLRGLLFKCGVVIPSGTLRSWVSRGSLKPVDGSVDARKREYRLGDVYALATRGRERDASVWTLIGEGDE